MTKKKGFAREDVMEEYLGGLLSGFDEPDERKVEAAKLLAKAELLETPLAPPSVQPKTIEIEQTESDISLETEAQIGPKSSVEQLVDSLDQQFQALFFEVAGLTLAVPLVSLGGIHQIDKVGPLFGKPTWFMGVMLHRDEKLNVVDTAKWVMPEKITEEFSEALNYQYLIMLADSSWGLASEKLVNTVTLNKTDVNWRGTDAKRPWLAGMVKERMCALIDVYQLISMLNSGLGRDDTQLITGVN